MEALVAFERQSSACAELGSPMYADLLGRAAADLREHGLQGPVGATIIGHEDDPGPSALGLRLLGSVHRLVLERRAGALATYYPSVGGTWEPEGGWAALCALLEEQRPAVREWLDRAPQTNEVGRAAALYGGLLHLPRDHPVRVFEIGASAGLNLRADHLGYRDDIGQVHGRADSALVLDGAWAGRTPTPWPGLRVVERVGVDLLPIDPTSTAGRLALTAYVWPDQVTRLERLRRAFTVAEAVPAELRRQSAADLVEGIDLQPGTTTVLWHSVMWQYLSREEQTRVADQVAALGAQATDEQPFGYLSAEPERRDTGDEHEFLVRLQVWPRHGAGPAPGRRVIGRTVAHGLPTTWE